MCAVVEDFSREVWMSQFAVIVSRFGCMMDSSKLMHIYGREIGRAVYVIDSV